MEAIKIRGRVIFIGQIQTGTTAKGDWSKQEFTVEFGDEQYPQRISCTAFPADKAKNIAVGSQVEVSVNFKAKEWEDKWYNSVDAWKIEILTSTERQAVTAPAYDPSTHNLENYQKMDASSEPDDLPF